MANGISESRLSLSTANLRKKLIVRNIYVPNNEYPVQNKKNADRVVDTINTIIGGIAPFKSYNLKNTVYGRLVTTPSPLTEIGLVMLGKQFALNSMSHLAQQTFPIIKVSNLFDGNKDTTLFTKRIDLNITKKSSATTFENFIDKIFYSYPVKDHPFTKDSNNADFIRNTGAGQLNFLYSSLNRNVFKQDDRTLIDTGNKIKNPIKPRTALVAVGNKVFFNFTANPYLNFYPSSESVVDANYDMIVSYNIISDIQEYAPSADFIRDNFGQTSKINLENDASALGNASDRSMNSWIDDVSEFSSENQLNKVVWGRDGTSDRTNKELSQLQGLSEEEVIRNYQPQDLKGGFNIRAGLLEYTRNLINASEGRIGDITRKAFTRGGKLVGFNGSGIWRAPSTALPEFAGRKGVRQHSALDQYDRFAKAIRFNGNNVYGGNENSVIYNNILPRVHPTLDKISGEINNKNLMFSIENLAIKAISKDGYGIIDDEYGSPIPACEVGPFNGRLMWFPPYNLEFNETASAKFEPTVMIGRNEPMYNYMHSERSATITFSLIVDYPPQLKNLLYQGVDKQKAIAEFFAFGGGDTETFIPVEKLEAQRQKLFLEIERIQGKPKPYLPENLQSEAIQIAYPNDLPNAGNVNTIFDEMYKTLTYEIIEGFPSSDGSSWGLNKRMYYISGLTTYVDISGNTKYKFDPLFDLNSFSQYNQGNVKDQMGESLLNAELFRIFNDEKNRPLYSVYVYGGASKLFTENIKDDVYRGEEYNLRLGKRRADAAIRLVESRLKAMFGKSAKELGIEVTYERTASVSGLTGSVGDSVADAKNATKVAIPNLETKNERKAIIQIRKNGRTPEPIIPPLSEEDKITIRIKLGEIEKIDEQINRAKKSGLGGCFMNERGVVEENGVGDTGILHGFQSISGNYYYPTFHSQTPEDFHRRLTFLHQCTRQGAAIRKDAEVDNTGILRARNSVFGRQPICVLRIGDFFYTKIIIENLTIDYAESTWDLNPEGFGLQPMMAKITLQIKIIGGQSLKGPIDALQNAVSFNYYANSTFTDRGMYQLPSYNAALQEAHAQGIDTGIYGEKDGQKVKTGVLSYEDVLKLLDANK